MHPLGHLKTITQHKLLVMGYCFRVGLIWQGLMHDMSKYSWTEFRVGAKYYSGTRSPNAAEREVLGYSTAWLHHKGRNRHHLEYWIDYGVGDFQLKGHPMPTKYMVELCLDRIAACRVYHGKDYTDSDPLEYLNRSNDGKMMHPETKRQVVEILTMLAEKGEQETLKYIRNVVLKHPVKNQPAKPIPEHPEEKDETFLPGSEIKALAKQLGTPCYLYSEQAIRETAKQLTGSFSWNPGHRQFFPVKATPTPGILRLLREEGQGVVCSSAAELELCIRSGFQPEEILFLPNYPRDEDLDKAAEVGCPVILDGVELVERFGAKGLLRGTVGLRINPGGVFRAGYSEAKLDGNKFGMSPKDARIAAQKLRTYGVQSVGLTATLLGNTLEESYYPNLAGLLADWALELHRETGMTISYLNLSGGLGIPYRPSQNGLDLEQVGKAVQAVLREKLSGTPLAEIHVYTELGRIVTGPGGVLVTTVTQIKEGRFAGVDASAADLMRPMMYGAYHHVSVAGKEGAKERSPWDVVGAVCENTDKFAESRQLPNLEVGDVLIIHDAGAHGHSMGYNYGGRLRCAEYLLRENGSIEMIRRAETTADHLATLEF